MFQESLSQVGVTAAYGAGTIVKAQKNKQLDAEAAERTKLRDETAREAYKKIKLQNKNLRYRNRESKANSEAAELKTSQLKKGLGSQNVE